MSHLQNGKSPKGDETSHFRERGNGGNGEETGGRKRGQVQFYDALSRLISVTTADPDDTGPLEAGTTELAYDKAGTCGLSPTRWATSPSTSTTPAIG